MKNEKYIENNCESIASLEAKILNSIHNNESVQYPTSFPQLDTILDGGLQKGLYVLAGAPSVGKTSLTLQIADNIAKEGHDVLFISLIESRTDLIAKSISRNTYKICAEENINPSNAKTARDILTGSRYESYSETELKLIDDAFSKYEEESINLYMHESMGGFGVTQVREAVEKHIAMTGNKPVVFIDSLQDLSINVDKVVLELKKISREFNIPVWATSRISRESYEHPVSLRSINNEAIEYLADVIIGMHHFKTESDEYMPYITIGLVVLKNKHVFSEPSSPITFFYPKFGLFQ